MARSTRENLIRVAHDMFYAQGFHAVGLEQIIQRVGVTKTTFYNHFASKEDLVLEVLRWHDRWWRDTFVSMLRKRGGDTPRGQLLAVFDVLEDLFNGDGYNGCIFVNVAVVYPLPHDPAHAAAAEHKRSMETIVRELAAYAGAHDPQAFAEEFSLLLEGAYVTAQVTGGTRVAEAGRRLVRRLVDHYLPEDGARPARPPAPLGAGAAGALRTERKARKLR